MRPSGYTWKKPARGILQGLVQAKLDKWRQPECIGIIYAIKLGC